MKKSKLLFGTFLAIPLVLASCGGSKPASTKYTFSFHGTKCSADNSPEYDANQEVIINITPVTGASLPAAPKEVKLGDNVIDSGYTYTLLDGSNKATFKIKMTNNVSVTVEAHEHNYTKLEFEGEPAKKEYNPGEEFDLGAMKVYAVCETDSTKEDVSDEVEFEYEQGDAFETGDTKVTIVWGSLEKDYILAKAVDKSENTIELDEDTYNTNCGIDITDNIEFTCLEQDEVGDKATISFEKDGAPVVGAAVVAEDSPYDIKITVPETTTYKATTKLFEDALVVTHNITELTYEGTPTKTTYNAFEEFDPKGLTFKGSCEECGPVDEIDIDDISFSYVNGQGSFNAGENKVIAWYNTYSCDIEGLTVNKIDNQITLGEESYTTTCKTDKTADITVNCSESATPTIKFQKNGADVEGSAVVAENSPYDIVVTTTATKNYNETTTKFNGALTVQHDIDSLTYEGNPTKTTYNAFERFNPTGLTFKGSCSGCGPCETIDTGDVDFEYVNEGDSFNAGETKVTATYGGMNCDVTGLTVNQITQDSLKLNDVSYSTTCCVDPEVGYTDEIYSNERANEQDITITYKSEDEQTTTTDPEELVAAGSPYDVILTAAASTNFSAVNKTFADAIEVEHLGEGDVFLDISDYNHFFTYKNCVCGDPVIEDEWTNGYDYSKSLFGVNGTYEGEHGKDEYTVEYDNASGNIIGYSKSGACGWDYHKLELPRVNFADSKYPYAVTRFEIETNCTKLHLEDVSPSLVYTKCYVDIAYNTDKLYVSLINPSNNKIVAATAVTDNAIINGDKGVAVYVTTDGPKTESSPNKIVSIKPITEGAYKYDGNGAANSDQLYGAKFEDYNFGDKYDPSVNYDSTTHASSYTMSCPETSDCGYVPTNSNKTGYEVYLPGYNFAADDATSFKYQLSRNMAWNLAAIVGKGNASYGFEATTHTEFINITKSDAGLTTELVVDDVVKSSYIFTEEDVLNGTKGMLIQMNVLDSSRTITYTPVIADDGFKDGLFIAEPSIQRLTLGSDRITHRSSGNNIQYVIGTQGFMRNLNYKLYLPAFNFGKLLSKDGASSVNFVVYATDTNLNLGFKDKADSEADFLVLENGTEEKNTLVITKNGNDYIATLSNGTKSLVSVLSEGQVNGSESITMHYAVTAAWRYVDFSVPNLITE